MLIAFSQDFLAAGRAALARGDWAAARDAFAAAGDVPDALEGLGWAGWWLSDEALTLKAREAAYRGYRAARDDAAAGGVAAWLASDYREFRGEDAVARGWLERAHRLLDPLPASADHGWLALNEGSFALNVAGDPEAAARLARFAARLGRELGVADLEAVGLAQEGIAHVVCGRVPDGMRRLDEASAIAATEELQLPLSHGWALCYLISACDGVGDFPRATQWCEVMREVAERWSGRQLIGVCRSNYGSVLATSGDWARGEGELVAAVDDLVASRPGQASAGLIRLGELRARQGRTGEARALFERAGSAGVLGLGELALHDGDAACAADSAERVLRKLPEADVLGRIPALELLVRGRARLGELTAAAAAFDRLEAAGETIARPTSSAASAFPPPGSRSRAAIPTRPDSPPRTPSTACPTAVPRTTPPSPASSSPARSRRSAGVRPRPPRPAPPATRSPPSAPPASSPPPRRCSPRARALRGRRRPRPSSGRCRPRRSSGRCRPRPSRS